MYDWLQKEIEKVKTPKFHLIEGSGDLKLQAAVEQSTIPLPASYKEFVIRFGNTKLYRSSRDGYTISIFAGPRERISPSGTVKYYIGYDDEEDVYIEPTKGDLYSIVEGKLRDEVTVGDNFEEWLENACNRVKKSLGKKKWEKILSGPEPFTRKEKEMLEIRRRIEWQVRGINAAGEIIFKITNNSNSRLPTLTLGVRSKSGHLNGGVFLDVRHIAPSQTAELHKSCYQNLVPPTEIEVFELPDPQPEDREYYWEFRG